MNDNEKEKNSVEKLKRTLTDKQIEHLENMRKKRLEKIKSTSNSNIPDSKQDSKKEEISIQIDSQGSGDIVKLSDELNQIKEYIEQQKKYKEEKKKKKQAVDTNTYIEQDQKTKTLEYQKLWYKNFVR
jgi:hypothetical protein